MEVETEKGKLDDLETFQSMYTATVDENSKKIEEVKGPDIEYWYSNERYLEVKGTLGGSCMSYPERNKYMSFYSLNPEKVSLLVLYPEGRRDKIIGRAMLWNIDEINDEKVEGVKFMDRIYTSSQADEELFIMYAKKNGYYYKSSQSYGFYPTVKPNGEQENMKLSVYINSIGYQYYPYVDTLTYYIKKDNKLINRIDDSERDKEIGTMTSQSGGISWNNY